MDRVFALTGLHAVGCQRQYCLYVVCFRYLHLSLFIRQLCRGKSRADSANELAYCKVVLPRLVKHQNMCMKSRQKFIIQCVRVSPCLST